MKKFMMLMLLIAILPAFAACSARVKDKDGNLVEVDTRDSTYRDGGRFCPPGHAKKGWC